MKITFAIAKINKRSLDCKLLKWMDLRGTTAPSPLSAKADSLNIYSLAFITFELSPFSLSLEIPIGIL